MGQREALRDLTLREGALTGDNSPAFAPRTDGTWRVNETGEGQKKPGRKKNKVMKTERKMVKMKKLT